MHPDDASLVSFPEVRGRRCLDVGTVDGFYASEMERRGAAEVVVVDVPDHEQWDWLIDARAGTVGALRDHPAVSGRPKGNGFRVLGDIIGSEVGWRPIPSTTSTPRFSIPSTWSSWGRSTSIFRTRSRPRRLCGRSPTVWCCPRTRSSCGCRSWAEAGPSPGCGAQAGRTSGGTTTAPHRQILWAAGFEEIDRSPFFVNRYNAHATEPLTMRSAPTLAAKRALTRDARQGVLHRARLGPTSAAVRRPLTPPVTLEAWGSPTFMGLQCASP